VQRVHCRDAIQTNRLEAAPLDAQPAAITSRGVNPCLRCSDEIMSLFDEWVEQQVQIGGIHIAVYKHGFAHQGCEDGREAGLPGAALAAQYHDLFHTNTSAAR
jgi:hypothetical protein